MFIAWENIFQAQKQASKTFMPGFKRWEKKMREKKSGIRIIHWEMKIFISKQLPGVTTEAGNAS